MYRRLVFACQSLVCVVRCDHQILVIYPNDLLIGLITKVFAWQKTTDGWNLSAETCKLVNRKLTLLTQGSFCVSTNKRRSYIVMSSLIADPIHRTIHVTHTLNTSPVHCKDFLHRTGWIISHIYVVRNQCQWQILPYSTHWDRDQMDVILQTILSNAFSSMKMFQFLLKFHWSLTISQHSFR